MTLSDKLRSKGAKAPKNRSEPLWEGPESDGDNGGISFSLLSRFLVCRERFRLLVVEGLKPTETFYPPIDYGNMWHLCEEAISGEHPDYKDTQSQSHWEYRLRGYCQQLCRKFPMQQEQVLHWFQMCKAQFPIYIDYWSNHPDQLEREPLLSEKSFKVPYKLPFGRTVFLRGKWDSVDLVNSKVVLQENKTKSQIDQRKLTTQLSADLQTMLYLIALVESQTIGSNLTMARIAGVRYNVIRRSAHKSPESMVKKIQEDIAAGRGGEWFARWNIEVSTKDIERFKKESFDPILENLCHWWDHISGACDSSEACYGIPPSNWRHPYGVWNPLDEGGSSDLDGYLATGSEVGLTRTDNLFPELT